VCVPLVCWILNANVKQFYHPSYWWRESITYLYLIQSPKRSEESSRRLASLRPRRSEARRGKDFKKLDEAKRGEAKACRGEATRFEKCYLGWFSLPAYFKSKSVDFHQFYHYFLREICDIIDSFLSIFLVSRCSWYLLHWYFKKWIDSTSCHI
jgi:hypothetical protein